MPDMIATEQCETLLQCCYVNRTTKVQMAKITNVHHWYFERVVFPRQRLIFNAPQDVMLEIYTEIMSTSNPTLIDTIRCQVLGMVEEP